jgi:hypothetical protein
VNVTSHLSIGKDCEPIMRAYDEPPGLSSI